MSTPRGLTADERALWERLAATVEPLHGRRKQPAVESPPPTAKQKQQSPQPKAMMPSRSPAPSQKQARVAPAVAPPPERHGLDTTWERKLSRGSASPDFTLDLHGASLDQAHARLDHGLVQAKAMGARVVLLITGKPRAGAAADRGERRGAIRAKVLDWLAAGPHGSDIAAIRTAHRRHGGEGALYLILRRRR